VGCPVVHFEIIARDRAAMLDYYERLFGWTVAPDSPQGYSIFAREDTGIQGGVAQGPEGYGGHVTVYVQVADAEAALARAEALGAARMMGPMEVSPGLVVGLFTAPAGHVVGVMEP
jgi:predicted enzyme related to lactoylglutathione lyase